MEFEECLDTFGGVECIMGIDEAGRGPVLGPMVYGACFCPISSKLSLSQMGFADSKTLSEERREVLFDKIRNKKGMSIGWIVDILSPEELSAKMLRLNKVNLNTISHDSAIGLIKRALQAQIKIKEVYLDTVGDPVKYQAKLQSIFGPDMKIAVSKKADSLFPIVSAASICAKVVRDRTLRKWEFKEPNLKLSTNFGSGYPSDPYTKKWLQNSLDPVFGFPSVMRFSWKTSSEILSSGATDVKWSDLDSDEEETGIIKPESNSTRDKAIRYRYFGENNMELVTEFQ